VRRGRGRSRSGVAFDLDQVEVARGIDHLFEQPGGVRLGMAEAHSMRAHVVGVTADVGYRLHTWCTLTTVQIDQKEKAL
jgi:hypothetical protein